MQILILKILFILYFNNVDGYIEKGNGNKYLVFASIDKNKEELYKYTELWAGTKNQIETINGGEPIRYKKRFHENKV